MKRIYLMASCLAIAAAFTGCSELDETSAPNTSKTYEATVHASLDDVQGIEGNEEMETRAMYIGGNNGNRFANVWDEGDKVLVYQGTTKVGSWSLDDDANEEYQGTKDAYLSGTLTGTFEVGDQVTLYVTKDDNCIIKDYTGQDGTIGKLSRNYTYRNRTVGITSITDNKIQLGKANMYHSQAYNRYFLTDQAGNRLHIMKLVVSATGENGIITSVADDGTETYGDIVVNTVFNRGEYPGEIFVALLNQGYTVAADGEVTNGSVGAYQLTAIDANGATWVFPGPEEHLGGTGEQKALNVCPTPGNLANVQRKMTLFNTSTTLAGNIAALEAGTDLGTGVAADASIIANQWTTGDKLTVWTGNISADTKATDFTCAAGGSAAGSFTSNLKFNAAPSSSTTLTAYAQSPALTVDDAAGTITLDLTEQDGTLANVQNYDLMWGNTTYDTKSIAFGHNVAFLKYDLDLGAENANTTATIELSGMGMFSKMSFNATDGSLKSILGTDITVSNVAVDAEGKASVYVALYPGNYKDAQAWITLSNGKQCPVAIGDGTFTLEAGKVYTANASETPIVITAHVGWYLNSDGTFTQTAQSTSVAVVFSDKVTKNDWDAGYKHGYAIALNVADADTRSGYRPRWDNQNTSFTYASENSKPFTWKLDREGLTETNSLVALTATGRTEAAKLARRYEEHVPVPTGFSEWFLPAIGQWYDILVNLGGMDAGTVGSYEGNIRGGWTGGSHSQTAVNALNAYNTAASEAGASVFNYYIGCGMWSSTERTVKFVYKANFDTASNNYQMLLDFWENNGKLARDYHARPAIAF